MKNQIETHMHIPDNIGQIAAMITQDWKKIYFGALPYLQAMKSLNSIQDSYYNESAKTVVTYFLANARTYRGEKARQIKAKLNQMIA
ncbi:hypothetical protein ACR78G_20085 [Sphingobacterium spiritivorum]|uniref:hypothetical protein n=1 Tax=Sphingobacterium spiritivorum TaxID=258 RepID=UPI003DA5F9DE